MRQVDWKLENGVAIVQLQNPPVNAMTGVVIEELTEIMDQLSEDAAVRVVILTGNGKVFCAGADLKEREKWIKKYGGERGLARASRECFHAIRECKIPVIGAINGAALGAGLAIVASCDILVASEGAVIGLPEIDVGLMGGVRHAQVLFAHSKLRRMAYTGYRVEAKELERLGIVEYVVSNKELMDKALEIAVEISKKNPDAIKMIKDVLNRLPEMSLRDGYRHEQDLTALLSKTKNGLEARAAYMEKRPPIFK